MKANETNQAVARIDWRQVVFGWRISSRVAYSIHKECFDIWS